ncbi:hypothetical protein CUMW_252930, partial [Citrus unshiu]
MWRRMALHLSPLISSSRSSTLNQTIKLCLLLAALSCIAYGASDKMWVSMSPKLFMLDVSNSGYGKGWIISQRQSSAPKSISKSLYKFYSSNTYLLTYVANKKNLFLMLSGGPGSGKGTRCTKIVKNFGLTHLSAGDLLRREIASNKVTISLIRKEIESSDNHKFLINGEENRAAFERIVTFSLYLIGAEPDIVLSFDGPEEEMVNRVLNHNKAWFSILLINIGPVDYNIDTVRKRLKVFKALNLPVINYYSRQGKLHM